MFSYFTRKNSQRNLLYNSELVMYIIMYCECIVSSLSLCNGVKSVVVVLETDVSGESDRACILRAVVRVSATPIVAVVALP